MSANKPKQQEVNRKPGQDEEDLNKGKNPSQRKEQGNDQGNQDKNKNKGGGFEKR
jgi:hypothetical protein